MSTWMKWTILMKQEEKKEVYSNLNMKDITDADYMHAKRVCKYR